MKYEITLMCGHTERFDLFGKAEDRESRAAWIGKNRLCKECYRLEKEREALATCELVTIAYSDYKTIFSDCLKKEGSYDPQTGTITVYIPIEHWEIYSNLLDSMPEAKVRELVTEAKQAHGNDFWKHLN